MLSLLSSIVLSFGIFLRGSVSQRLELYVPLLNVLVVATAFVHNQDYWGVKVKVPFVGGFNEGIQKSKEIRQLLVIMGIGWILFGGISWAGL